MKTCTKCGEAKSETEFYIKRKEALMSECKECVKKRSNKYRNSNKSRLIAQRKSHYEENKDEIKQRNKDSYEKHKENYIEIARIYRENNRDKIKLSNKARKGKIAEYRRKKYAEDTSWALTLRLRSRINSLIRGNKSKSTRQLIGCSASELVNYIESKFKDGMSWKNRSEWHIDHIRPCASFDLTDEDQQRKCFHYSNLQPLWALDNLEKSDKWNGEMFVEMELI